MIVLQGIDERFEMYIWFSKTDKYIDSENMTNVSMYSSHIYVAEHVENPP